MDAVISGSAGKALLLDGDEAWLLSVDDLSTKVPVGRQGIRMHFGAVQDLQILEDTQAEDVARALQAEHDCATALDLLLISFDPELSKEVRTEALEVLDELLSETRTVSQLEDILYARPLSDKADIVEAVQICQTKQYLQARHFLQQLKESQEGIHEVYLAWESIPITLFDDPEQASNFRQVVINQGFFHALAVARGSQPKVNQFRMDFLTDASIRSMHHYREVLQQWVRPFLKGDEFQTLPKHISEEDDLIFFSKKGQKRIRKGRNRALLFENTTRQKEAIVKALQEHDYVRTRNLLDDLITHHLNFDGPKYAVMSLCDLAIEAKTLGIYSLQLELTEKCINLQPTDSWSWAQYSDALLRVQRPKEALKAYRQAEEFGAGYVARSGRADVLKTMGRFNEALAAYDAVIADYPKKPIARNGRADVLKDMGRLNEALAAYEKVIADYPESIYARNGRADVLKTMGRLNEALSAYDAVITEYPTEPVARHGRADVLKTMGRLNEALAAYDALIADYPENVYARGGRADLLKVMGRLDKALATYDAIIIAYPEDAVARGGRADVLKTMGRLNEALTEYDDIISEYPADVYARGGRAEVLKAQGRYDDALAAYDAIIQEYPEDVYARGGRADVLKEMGRPLEALAAYELIIEKYPQNIYAKAGRAGVLKTLGRLNEAGVAYDALIAEYPENVVAQTGRASVFKAMGQFHEALTAYEEVIDRFPEDVYARGGRADVLKVMGRLEDALAAYNTFIAVYPKNPVSRSGRADLLKTMGRLDDALAAYEAIIADYPEDAVARNGRADVLKAMGRLDETLTAYEEVIAEYPANVYAKGGRADVLKVMGQLEEALAAYDAVIAEYPANPVARTGRSSVLLGLHRYEEALQSLPENDPITFTDWVGFHIRGMILLRTGNIDEAISVFERGPKEDPWPIHREYFRTSLVVAHIKRRDFIQATHVLDDVTSLQLQPQANVYRLHANGELKNDESAYKAYQNITRIPYFISDELVAELHRRYILKEEPHHDDEWVDDKEDTLQFLVASQHTVTSQAYLY